MRRALEELHDEGLIDSRQGLGWFVAADPLRQSLGRLGTIEAQLADAGIASERRVLDFGFVAAPARVRKVLGVRRVLEVRRCNLADGHPFARVTVWCPERLGKGLSLADVERAPFYELLDAQLGGASQTIAAVAAAQGRRGAARGPGRLTGAHVPAHDAHGGGRAGAVQRARLRRPPHGVRRRPARRRPVDGAVGPPARRGAVRATVAP